MSGFKPSPGPWKVFLVESGPNKGQLLGVGEMNGNGVTDAYGGLWGDGGEKLANAYLIAAAPELLAASKKLMASIADMDPEQRGCSTVAYSELWEAIAKAEASA